MELGRIVHSNSHVDYVCQIAQRSETPQAPEPEQYAFGVLVGIEGAAGTLVGLIYDTRLLNPEFGNLGPRLSPRDELLVFSPDYIAETATLVGILAIGLLKGGDSQQGVPAIAVEVGSAVRTLTEAEIIGFHRPGGRLRVAYLPQLLAQGPIGLTLAQRVLAQLQTLLPEDRGRLQVLASTVAWRAAVGGLQEGRR
ncbi:MAG: hypothetical protein ACOX3S_14630 [Anaerolineae bacterium]|jgi:hypothetical protein